MRRGDIADIKIKGNIFHIPRSVTVKLENTDDLKYMYIYLTNQHFNCNFMFVLTLGVVGNPCSLYEKY